MQVTKGIKRKSLNKKSKYIRKANRRYFYFDYGTIPEI
ncbi:hypothetical protein B4146_2056 [Bacillus subtilis]|uniref:Uncharacterized protein n=1 Tax=Bacillus subtilis TaxID=1423 RepID=A0AAP1EGH7_BACIU|nr:hypothetical protein B4146_2056 [Bacillus subtilis]KZD95252.1 hypothetical protein B4122_0224 [Bacillus subtilis]